MNLSSRVGGIAPSATLAIAARAKALQRAGVDVISLSVGEPDFDTPAHITAACIEALRRGETHYAPGTGLPALLEAIAAVSTAQNRIPCSPDRVIVTAGAKDAIHQAMQAVLNPGDEVIVLTPDWVSYGPCIRLADGVPVFVPVDPTTFQLTDALLEAVTDRTRMIVVNSPSNPSGAVLDRHSLGLVADVCRDNGIVALSDEIYDRLVYGVPCVSLASLAGMEDLTVTINGFSKAYAMTGWRLGWALGPKPVIDYMARVQSHTTSQAVTFVMHGGLAALTGDQSPVEEMRRAFDQRRRYVLGRLAGMGYRTAPADGAFYAFVEVGGDDVAVASRWLDEARVAVTPGSAFHAPGWLRISYATSLPRLEEAMDRVAAL
ncbi:MAG TPA: pyridoxal phosphate-dependent aminotransferase [Methanoregulaceae archaeon]|nr:pyridoxal phosphate-dependent aminotransferase [Methanoregulaceae archaeon]HQJ88619.1 pyridoxal phosphate-dependent aminotransferase [Methanoregulaceae archaeon]